MTVGVVYVFPISGEFDAKANRFADTFRAYPPLHDHAMIVVINGGKATDAQKHIFRDIDCLFIEGDNAGYDIGAYQMVSEDIPTNVMACFGASAYFKRPGWLKRMMNVYETYGPNLYGTTASLWPIPHIRTTGFWFPVELLRSYPLPVASVQDRYEFEHRKYNFTAWAVAQHLQAMVATWNYVVNVMSCNTIPNGYWNGDQSECLAFDRCTELHCP